MRVGFFTRDGSSPESHTRAMTHGDWFLQEWMTRLGKRQASLVNELGWEKSRAYHVWHGRQPYRRETVNQISAWLGIEPYELLMPPDEAMHLRRLRESAYAIAADAAEFIQDRKAATPG